MILESALYTIMCLNGLFVKFNEFMKSWTMEVEWNINDPSTLALYVTKSIHVMLKYYKVTLGLMFDGGFEKDGEADAFIIDFIIAHVTWIYNAMSQLYELQDANNFALDNYSLRFISKAMFH